MRTPILQEGDGQAFQQDGFVVVRNLLDADEADLLGAVARADYEIQQSRSSRADGEGGSVELVVRNHLDDSSIYSAIVQSQPLVEAMETLLEDEVYHYHHKMILKEPHVGGAWTWHQDYGYWYNFGCLYPDMGSCMIAVDRATQENGCLQVLRGSHRMGRIDHGKRGDQTGADLERVEAAMQRHPLVHVALEPGDAVIFHCNLLHRSDRNNSDFPRWAFICCYNTRHNDPWKNSRHPGFTPLQRVCPKQILAVGKRQLEKLSTI